MRVLQANYYTGFYGALSRPGSFLKKQRKGKTLPSHESTWEHPDCVQVLPLKADTASPYRSPGLCGGPHDEPRGWKVLLWVREKGTTVSACYHTTHPPTLLLFLL